MGIGSTPVAQRVAGAPISWGVCEVPGWGWQYDLDTVLTQMTQVGLIATEFGPDGFLPRDALERAGVLSDRGLRAVGGFVPVVLHDPGLDPAPQVETELESFVASGAGTLVLAAATGRDGYDDRPVLDATGWRTMLANLDALADLSSAAGVVATLHPHVGTMIETADEVERLLQGSAIGLCLDTGHLLVGGADPVAIATRHPDRIRHTHLKDVDAGWADRVRRGEVGYTEAVRAGMYRPLGQGDVNIAQIVNALESQGYQGWYVVEQDTVLTGPPMPGEQGPVADVRTSVDYLRSVADGLPQ